jgi:hypothetical protein
MFIERAYFDGLVKFEVHPDLYRSMMAAYQRAKEETV